MISAFFKKLLSSFLFLFIYSLFAMAVAYIWMRIAAICKEQLNLIFGKTFNYSIIAILTLLVELLAVYCIRIDNLNAKKTYLNIHATDVYSFHTDFAETLKTKEHILHTIAFNTLMLPLFLLIGTGAKISGVLLIVFAIAFSKEGKI